MILCNYGREGQLAFLDEVKRGALMLEPFSVGDFARARDLMNGYPHL